MKGITTLLLLLTTLVVFGQDKCGFAHTGEILDTRKDITQKTSDNCNKIRTVVHVVYDTLATPFEGDGLISEEQVKSQIRIANQFFRNDSLMYSENNNVFPYEIVLDDIKYHNGVAIFGQVWHDYGLKNDGVFGVSVSQLSNELAVPEDEDGIKYLNSYVVSKIDGRQGGGVQAFAYFPTSNNVYGNYNLFNTFGAEQLEDEYSQEFDLKSYTDRGLVWVHELMHNFGIFHTFQGNNCEEGNCNLQGDRVCDTQPQTQGIGCSGSCGFVSHNIMDYLSESCKDRLTIGQIERASLVVQNSLSDYLICDDCTPNLDGDLNKDGVVNIIDMSLLNLYFGCAQGDECYDSFFDSNCDGLINIVDASYYGQFFNQGVYRDMTGRVVPDGSKGWLIYNRRLIYIE